MTIRHLDSLVSPEMADKANLGKEASPTCGAEVGRGCAVCADGSSLACCSLLLGLTGPAFLCCLGSFGDAFVPGGSVGGKRLPGLSADRIATKAKRLHLVLLVRSRRSIILKND